ncbi:TauD/TfdA family dioxygenase [Streptomyces pactum]|uniref:TauD/TfdA family dioxygenase n=2 Tax=Streptomyces pactum TaxID=68249 RepID=A0ABS0NH26_9ACTN|nr:TauD/TfdA family dioxygenase [Streptomyces pactum]MBH5334499.1 TauD/TfdA family dioxygenase [Streptomyces pactum]
MGLTIEGFDVLGAPADRLRELKEQVYRHKIVVLRDQRLTPAGFVALGRRLGEVETYYQPMYHHPEHPEIFVSSHRGARREGDGAQLGVPRTGTFWHHDYAFMPRPFGLTLVWPQVVPERDRGTYFIDMGAAYRKLPDALKAEIAGTFGLNSVRRYFKIRPSDVYRPVCEVLAEIEEVTPACAHPTVFAHPVTGERVLYVSEAVTCGLQDAGGNPLRDGLLRELLDACGQSDGTFTHENIHLQTFDRGDLLIWDNRSLVHRARHTATPEPAVSFRVTVHDEYEFYPGIGRPAGR